MKFDGTIDIATGASAGSLVWKNKKIRWSELVEKLSKENRTNETFKEFISYNKKEQGKIKDVGGYVGGYVRNGRRKRENIVHRQILTLDIDFAHLGFWDDFLMQFSNAAAIHGTHKHHSESPRYRLIIPLARECSPDEYEAVARQIAGVMGIDLFDNTTFQVHRLMFWPSNPSDIEYYFEYQDGPWVDPEEILATYIDWKDSALWPTADKAFEDVKNLGKKQQNPEDKKGIVGAFCRSYGICEVISAFLPEEYVSAGEDRYTYVNGSTAGGLIVYDNLFAFSHHGTDPCSGKLCNSFDLVRIHKFGHLDSSSDYKTQKRKSYTAMEDFARDDRIVKKLIATENIAEANYDFADDIELEEEDTNWMEELETDNKSKYLSTASNINLILANDMRLKKLFKYNEFDAKRYVFNHVPWRKILEPEPMKNVDYSGVRNYIESIYGIVGNIKIDDSLSLEFEKHSFHPVRDYLNSLKWDGKERVDRLLIDYFGVEDTLYTREAIRKTLVGAVGRIFVPGIKFDLVLSITGEQGCGKSTFISKLGKKWFSDTFMTVQGKEALEQIQGSWIIEMAELAGLRKAEVEPIKHFISKQEDNFRPAYARTPETFKRQCIFIVTTNNRNFLKDPTGNRRFIPVDVDIKNATKSIFNGLEGEVDQIWAEATEVFNNGGKLYMSKEAESLAKIEQKGHSENDERRGIVEKYINTLLPINWEDLDIHQRRDFLNDPLSSKGVFEKDYVCVAEIWCECLGKDKENMDRYKTRDLNDILKSLDNWDQSKSTKNFSLYGKQKYYTRNLL